MNIGEKIKILRKEKKVSQRKMASDFSITNPTISMWENSLRKPDTETLKKLANYFNVSISYFFDEDENKVEKISTEGNLTVEQKELIEKIKTLDDFQCKRLSLYLERMIEDDRKEEETVKKLYNQYHNKNKLFDNN